MKRGMIINGTRARRMSSRLRGSPGPLGKAVFWNPLTLHWRRVPRPRAPHHASALAGSWMSIFAPRIVLHFLSNLNAVAKSTVFANTRRIVQPRMIRRDTILHHRETLREQVSLERILAQARERFSTLARVDFVLREQLQRRADAPGPAGSSPRVHPARNFSVTARSTVLTTHISNSSVDHTHDSASLCVTYLAPTIYRRERASRVGFHPVEPSRVHQRTELVWRQPQPVAKSETHGHDSFEAPRRHRAAAFESPRMNEPSVKSATAPAAPSFDAAQMDRLVDNVIQGVDKRVRIERERRGW